MYLQKVMEVIEASKGEFELGEHELSRGQSALVEVGVWPENLPTVADYWCATQLATIRRNSVLLMNVLNSIALSLPNRYDCLSLNTGTITSPCQLTMKLLKLLCALDPKLFCIHVNISATSASHHRRASTIE